MTSCSKNARRSIKSENSVASRWHKKEQSTRHNLRECTWLRRSSSFTPRSSKMKRCCSSGPYQGSSPMRILPKVRQLKFRLKKIKRILKINQTGNLLIQRTSRLQWKAEWCARGTDTVKREAIGEDDLCEMRKDDGETEECTGPTRHQLPPGVQT